MKNTHICIYMFIYMYTYIHTDITESLCHAPEMNTTRQINYISIKMAKLKNMKNT